MIVPYRVTTLTMRSPWANLVIIGLNVIMFFLTRGGAIPDGILDRMVLTDFSPMGLIGHQFLHAGYLHLIGNMILLWVFGNALNGIMHDLDYVLAYLATGAIAGITHLLVDGHPVIGASGAISGMMGLYLTVYPKNDVSCFYWFIRAGTFDVKGYILIIGWFAWDIFSALRHVPGIACWAHVGGTVAGFFIGLLLLKLQRIHIGDYDNPTILDLVSGRTE
jgi:membrane associated rhomboid family serine protease